MSTQRRYYEDAYTTQFDANVIECVTTGKKHGVVLDFSYFYPTSGGQPNDMGSIQGQSVVDVTIRDEDQAVVHWLAGENLDLGEVTAVIDWQRRFDHMQQHTGQHILSQAFLTTASAATVGFHLGEASVTIDLDKAGLPPEVITRTETLANQIVYQNRPVNIQFVTPEQAARLPLRKRPPAHNGRLRLIEIEDFDLSACGGTHVRHTGEVGVIKVIKREKRGNFTRVEFRCGGRALADYDSKNGIIADLANQLTTAPEDFVAAYGRLQAENKQLHRANKRLLSQLMAFEADRLAAEAKRQNGFSIVSKVFTERTPAQLRQLGNQLAQRGGTMALLGIAGEKSHLFFCRSEDIPGDMSQLLKQGMDILGGGGGGTSAAAQGGGPAVTAEKLASILRQVAASHAGE